MELSGDQPVRGEASPADSGFRVETGALDDGRHRSRQLVAAAGGWVLAALLIGYLASAAGSVELRLTLFLATVAVVVAIIATAVAVDLLRPELMRERVRVRAPEPYDRSHDALGRRIETADLSKLDGEIRIELDGEVRRYFRAPGT